MWNFIVKSESDIGKIAVAGSLDKYNSLTTGAMKKYRSDEEVHRRSKEGEGRLDGL